MEELLENVVRKLIFKKYPYLYDVKVEDRFNDIPNLKFMVGSEYACYLKSEECLPAKKQMEIDTEVKLLFEMLSPLKKYGRVPNVSCYFDCGEGYEFHSEPGYNH
jgi:hypothetical protein